MADLIVPGGIGGGLISHPSYGGGGEGGEGPPPGIVALYSADEGVITSGANVTSWQDDTGGYHANYTSGNYPQYIIDGDGIPGVQFFNSILETLPTLVVEQPFTYYMVLKQNTWDWDRFIITSGDGLTGVVKQSGGTGNVAGYSGSLGPTGPVGTTDRKLVKITFNGVFSECYVNGVLTSTGAIDDAGINGLCLGWDFFRSVGSAYDGVIHALAVCDSTLADHPETDEIISEYFTDTYQVS